MAERQTRLRRVCAAIALVLAAALATAAAAVAQSTYHGAWNFVTSPSLHPPAVAVTTNKPGTAPGYLFVAPIAAGGPLSGQPGPLILDGHGRPVWVHPLHGMKAMDFRPQTYRGQPVLTWWQGHFNSLGIGSGTDVILDSSYHQIATVRAGNGYTADLHEFLITPQSTAMITAYKTVPIDLSGCCGGDRNGSILDSIVQEVDIRTGRVLWQWDPLRHVRLQDSYTYAVHGQTWDPYHLNSIDVDSAGDVLVSIRNTWAAYLINKRTGGVFWRLGGKRSSFSLGSGVRFAYQHDVRFTSGQQLSVFDDEAAPEVEPRSRALLVRLDTVHHAAHLVHAYEHPGVLAGSQGSTQLLPNGNVFAGWGQKPYFSEYTPGGRLLFDGHFHGYDESYRTYRFQWTGRPPSRPAVVVQPGSYSPVVYCSWNGETGIAAWVLFAGPASNEMKQVAVTASQGFETAFTPPPAADYQVVALDQSGHPLGASPVVGG